MKSNIRGSDFRASQRRILRRINQRGVHGQWGNICSRFWERRSYTSSGRHKILLFQPIQATAHVLQDLQYVMTLRRQVPWRHLATIEMCTASPIEESDSTKCSCFANMRCPDDDIISAQPKIITLHLDHHISPSKLYRQRVSTQQSCHNITIPAL